MSEERPRVTLKQLTEEAIKHSFLSNIDKFTCYDCTAWQECEWAFDSYNTNGDCLREK